MSATVSALIRDLGWGRGAGRGQTRYIGMTDHCMFSLFFCSRATPKSIIQSNTLLRSYVVKDSDTPQDLQHLLFSTLSCHNHPA